MSKYQHTRANNSGIMLPLLCLLPVAAVAFVPSATVPHSTSSLRHVNDDGRQNRQLVRTIVWASTKTTTTTAEEGIKDDVGTKFDALLDEPTTTSLRDATRLLRDQKDKIDLTRSRFGKIFDAIEATTSAAEEQSINTRLEQEVLSVSKSRQEMTGMYNVLKDQGHLRMFGAITKDTVPAAGSHSVRPSMLETITLLSMKALTPKPSNTLLYAGVGVAVIEALASAYLGLDLNLLFFLSVAFALSDRVFLNGALSETVAKALSPETQPKITRHEAGHFLCSYMLGCPVEGYVLSAWAALQDPRFGPRGVSAGTSFFDSDLSSQISTGEIKRSSIDRYSIIVMAGIAAEAVNYGRADGGAGDELALISFLSNLNGGAAATGGVGGAPVWNDLTIRNQARWGALQAVLILREYKPCYDALVDALERGGSLGDCIYAIENAARLNNLSPPKMPLGYIVECSDGQEKWETELPEARATSDDPVRQNTNNSSMTTNKTMMPTKAEKPLDKHAALETLKDLKKSAEDKLHDLENKLEKYDS